MITGADIESSAREWLGTPFIHQGRVKGKGVDCVGLLVGVAKQTATVDYDMRRYPPDPSGEQLREILDTHLIPAKDIHPGCVLLIAFDKRLPKHVGIASSVGMIHAYARARAVREHRLNDMWRKRIKAVYQVPGVQYG